MQVLPSGDPTDMTPNLEFLPVQSGMITGRFATDSGLARSCFSKLERGLSSLSICPTLEIAEGS
jgi:hypothetical protein